MKIKTLTLAASLAVCVSHSLVFAGNPSNKADGDWVSVIGTIASSSEQTFVLDFGEGMITVEMDSWHSKNQRSKALQLNPGERVTVYGALDDDLYQKRTIEADSVYVHDRGIYYSANPTDEEAEFFTHAYSPTVSEGSFFTIIGKVAKIEGRTFVVDTGSQRLKVDTSSLDYNPLDSEGHQQLRIGARVLVSGTLDLDIFEEREILATSVVTLQRSKRHRKQTEAQN